VNLVRLLLFALALAAIGALATLAGRASGLDVPDEPAGEAMAHAEGAGGPVAAGLSDSASGLRLGIVPTTLRAGVPGRLRLTLTDERGAAVTELDEAHGEPPLHLILVRRDLAGYLHLHPERSGDGFTAAVTLPRPGVWRAYADFERDGEKTVLGRDLLVPGAFEPRELPAAVPVIARDGYEVELDAGELHAGEEATLAFRVERGGSPVGRFQPYLGAQGHLVAIRADDLAYLHVHPRDGSAPGTVAFDTELAEPGRYALFLQFRHGGAVRTVPFTVEVSP
jgi:hypothetical protein